MKVRTAVVILSLALPLVIAPGVGNAAGPLEIRSVSNRADLVSGGDVLLEVVLPAGVDASSVRVDVGGRDVSEAFELDPAGRLLGRVEGLSLGANTVTAGAAGAGAAELLVTNHPIGGPVLSGPHMQPWDCRTEDHGLAPAVDEDCNAPTIHRFVYRDATTGQFLDYDPEAPPPADAIATTTTDEGVTVPYIVRNERGTVNRSVYDVAVLFDPSQPWTPTVRQEAWNGKFYYTFGGGCANKYWQTANSGAVLDDRALSRGFAVASAGLNVLGNNCNEVLSAETVMMVKERVIETYGPIRYTMGTGCSGGSLQQYSAAASYPGLLDGIQPSCTFADITTTVNEVHDCKVLLYYFTVTSPELWQVEAQRAAVLGHLSTSSCASHQALNLDRSEGDPTYCGTSTSVYSPPTGTVHAPGQQEAEWAYHPTDNPSGARCGIWDFTVNVWGRRPDGKANRPWNNIGIQYGLTALQTGLITPEQFVDLNRNVGGLDIDYQVQPERTAPDPGSVATAYRSARVTTGAGLAKTAIIDAGGWEDVELHTNVRAWSVKERMKKTNGTAANHVLMRAAQGVTDPAHGDRSFELLDRWLAGVEADDSSDPLEQKILRNRPTEAVDSCTIGTEHVTDPAACRNSTAWSHHTNPRMAAGQSLADDVMQCQLKPLRQEDYTVEFTDAQWAELEAVFPDGVCNWALPSVGEQPPVLWATYAPGPGGTPLGDPPTSQAAAGGPPPAGASTASAAVPLPTTGDGAVALAVLALGAAALLRRRID